MSRILYFADGCPPRPGEANLGPDIRAHQIIAMLERLGHQVTLSINTCKYEQANRLDLLSKENIDLSWSRNQKKEIFAKVKPDIVYFGALTAHSELWTPEVPTIIECAGPTLLEKAFCKEGNENLLLHIQSEINALSKADTVVCFGERQKWYYILEMVFAGFPIKDRPPITIVPNGVDEDILNKKRTEKGFSLAYVGGVHPWTAVDHVIDAAITGIEQSHTGQFTLIGGITIATEENQKRWENIQERISRSTKSRHIPTMPYFDLIEHLMSVSVALEWTPINFERILAVAYRTSLCLGCGIPIITNEGSEIASLIRQYNAGWVGPDGDLDWVRSTVARLATSPQEVEIASKNARKLATEHFSYICSSDKLNQVITNLGERKNKGNHVFSNGAFWLSPVEFRFLSFLRNHWFRFPRRFLSRLLCKP